MTRLSIIVPSSGRPSLAATLSSAAAQMRPGDELLADVNRDGDYGNAARRRKMEVATGDALLFQDDDDVYAPGALDVVRDRFGGDPGRLHVFRMRYRENGAELWADREVREGNVASQMICVPNVDRALLGRWSDRYESDYDFIRGTCECLGEPAWHEEVISLVRHPVLGAEPAVGVVITTCAGREENLRRTLRCLAALDDEPAGVTVVFDGCDAPPDFPDWATAVRVEKHEPHLEQPRNTGFRALRSTTRMTHCWFLDSDMVFGHRLLGELQRAVAEFPDCVVLGPYDWLPPGEALPDPELRNDPRWPAFERWDGVEKRYSPEAALACFGGNVVWPVTQFEALGGYDAALHHGRCEDGDLGARAAGAGVPIVFRRDARAWHVHHPVDLDQVYERNARDVPVILQRLDWAALRHGLRLVPEEGARLDWECPDCRRQMNCHLMWGHRC